MGSPFATNVRRMQMRKGYGAGGEAAEEAMERDALERKPRGKSITEVILVACVLIIGIVLFLIVLKMSGY